MKQRTFFYLCLTVSLLGLGIVYAADSIQELEETELKNVDRSMVGETVIVSGTVQNSFFRNGNLFFKLENNNTVIPVVKFDSEVNPDDGKKVEVEGTVELYEGELEIIADKIYLD